MSRRKPLPPTTPPLGVQITYHSQLELSLNYVRRTGAHMRMPTMLADREARRLEAGSMLARPRGGALKDQSPGAAQDPRPLDGA